MGKSSLSPTHRRLITAFVGIAVMVGGLLVPLSAQAAASVAVPDAVARILTDTNALRAAGGLAPLTESTTMDTVAQNWAAQMYASGSFVHNPNYSSQIPSGWSSAAENIASGYSYTTVVEAWHQSAGHYANIMGAYNSIGIGYYEVGSVTYFVQDFGSYSTVPSPKAAAAPASSPSSTPTPSTSGTPTASAVPTPALPSSATTAGLPRGSFDSATPAFAGVRVTGWAVDPTTAAPAAITVTVDGVATRATANVPLNWFTGLYPDFGTRHGFDLVVAATPGSHTICITAPAGNLGCRSAFETSGAGSADTIAAVSGGVQITGWSVDLGTAAPSYVWINVDGLGGPSSASSPVAWMDALYPGIGTDHGFSVRVGATKGYHNVCVYGTAGVLLRCQVVYVSLSDAGSFDSVSSRNGAIHVQGWSADLRGTAPSYIWINVNGSGTAYIANQTLPWFETLFPGAGINHGFDISIPAGTGTFQVCVYGTSSLLGCKTVANTRSAGALDSAAGVAGGVRLTGWSVDLATTSSSYIWVNVDGYGGPYVANNRLDWFSGLYSDAGLNHGFELTVSATPGTHLICVYGTELLLGCRTVTVPSSSS